ncbi:MAG: glutathione S-transferase family protein [Devosia sp.]
MYALYIANKNYSSWSLRPWLLMRETGIAFEELLQVFGGGSNYEAFRSFSPSGKVPALVDGDLTVWDSLAIAEYLAEAHEGIWPADRAARAWARSAAAEMHSGFSALRTTCGMNCGLRVKLNAMSDAVAADLRRIDELWREGLAHFGGPFLAGDRFTAVDAFYAPVAFRMQTYGLSVSPEAAAYRDRLLGLPGMRDWYQAALAETWRDAGHEDEIAHWGVVTADHRAG